MLLDDIIEDYLAYCRTERGMTVKSMKTWGSWLRFFHKWLVSSGHEAPTLAAFNPITLKRYLYHLAGLNYRPRTIRAGFATLRGLGTYLMAQGALNENPAPTVTASTSN